MHCSFFNIVVVVAVIAIAEYRSQAKNMKSENLCRLCCKVAVAVLTAEG